MKKITSIFLLTTVLLMSTTTAFAHCGGNRGHRNSSYRNSNGYYYACNYEDCEYYGTEHSHRGYCWR